jgi:hypothetical protein
VAVCIPWRASSYNCPSSFLLPALWALRLSHHQMGAAPSCKSLLPCHANVHCETVKSILGASRPPLSLLVYWHPAKLSRQ